MGWLGDRPSGVSGAGAGFERGRWWRFERGKEGVGGEWGPCGARGCI